MQGLVPETLLNRSDKMGYNTPNNLWINDMKETVKPYFNASLADIMDVKKIHANYSALLGQPNSSDNGQTFKFISFAVWHKIFKL